MTANLKSTMTSIRAKDRGSTRINESHRNVLAGIVVLVVFHKLFLAAIHPTASSRLGDKSSSSSSSAEERKIEFPTDEDTTYKPFIAIVSCITSNTDRHTHTIDDLLINKLLPSIHATISHEELDRFHVEILFGYDDTDEYWRETLHQQALLTTNNDGRRIPISFIPLKKDGDRPYHIPFNELCQKAYDRGVHYLVRINDDTYFLTNDWLTLAVNTLQSFDPPNVGVVGPSCVGDASQEREILTIDMTYLPYHMVIFDNMYYPEVFDNYYIDDWISRVYDVNNRTRRLKEWEMRHDTQAYGTRYRPSFGQDEYLEDEVEKGRKRVESFVENLMSSNE